MFQFGKSIEFQFFLVDPNTGEHIDLSLPSVSLVEANIYKSKPSRDEVLTGSAEIESVTSWSASSVNGANGKLITFSAIADPGLAETQTQYYISVLYKLESAGTNIVSIQPVTMTRPLGQAGSVSVQRSDLKKIYSTIDAIASTTQQDNAILVGINLAKSKLAINGIKWAQLNRPEQLNQAITYLSLGQFMISEMAARDDRYIELGDRYTDIAFSMLKSLQIEMNSSDGADKQDQPARTISIVQVMR